MKPPRDNKIILNCQACHARALVDVEPIGETRFICPYCMVINRVYSEKRMRKEYEDERRRK